MYLPPQLDRTKQSSPIETEDNRTTLHLIPLRESKPTRLYDSSALNQVKQYCDDRNDQEYVDQPAHRVRREQTE
jgi:hypothetical protein